MLFKQLTYVRSFESHEKMNILFYIFSFVFLDAE